MDYKSAVESIAEIEKRFDVNSVTCDGLKVWPLVRLDLWSQLLDPSYLVNIASKRIETNKVSQVADEGTVKLALKKTKASLVYLRNYILHSRELKRIKNNGPADVLIFSRYWDYTDKFNEKYYNRHIDPMHDFLSGMYRPLKVELLSAMSDETMPRVKETIFFNMEYYSNMYLDNNKGDELAVEGIEDLAKTISDFQPGVYLDEARFKAKAAHINFMRDLFLEILSVIKPKAVFLTCYYYEIAMALIWACKIKGITTVDIQHGCQGKYHGLYTHWIVIPETGYELLPDYFWAWGNETKRNIERDRPVNNRCHKVVVGGNRWLAKWIKGGGNEFNLGDENLPDKLKCIKDRKSILVSLQMIDNPLPEHLIAAMRKAPSDWIWLIRLPPRSRDKIDVIKSLLKQNAVSNYEIESSTNAPLYLLLKYATHHITCWSSVCYEALSFKVPTTIVHETGKQIFADYIEKGIFSYADTADEIIDSINESRNKNDLDEIELYIETSDKIAENAIAQIMQNMS